MQNDRVTGLVWIRLLSGKDASPLTKAAIDALEPFRDQIHTITADNGKEFSFHEEIARKLNTFVGLLCKTIPLVGKRSQ